MPKADTGNRQLLLCLNILEQDIFGWTWRLQLQICRLAKGLQSCISIHPSLRLYTSYMGARDLKSGTHADMASLATEPSLNSF